jgi:hypothetical protein
LIGGLGTNSLFAWSFAPQPLGDSEFGIFTDGLGNLFQTSTSTGSITGASNATPIAITTLSTSGLSDGQQVTISNVSGNTNANGTYFVKVLSTTSFELYTNAALTTGRSGNGVFGGGGTWITAARQLENTGLNRMLGGERNDSLFGGTVVDFMYGAGGIDTLYRADGTTFESLDDGLADNDWKNYARESDQVWYVGGTNAADKIDLNFVTEPGLLTDHHLLTRLTNNNGNFSFAAQIRLDFEATDSDGNPVWDPNRLKFKVDELLANTDPSARTSELSKIAVATSDATNEQLLASIIPPEGDFKVILIDALGGNDQITVGPTVQKSVWIDAGDGDDVVEILAGNAILVDKTESSFGGGLRGRNDIPTQAYTLAQSVGGQFQAFNGTAATADGLEFNGLTIDNPADVDWYRFTLATAPTASSVLQLASGSPIDGLGMEIFSGAPLSAAIIGASNTSTITITTTSTTGLVNGQLVSISGVAGNTNANGTYFVKVVSATTFELYINADLTTGRAGNAAYTGGGIWNTRLSGVSAILVSSVVLFPTPKSEVLQVGT